MIKLRQTHRCITISYWVLQEVLDQIHDFLVFQLLQRRGILFMKTFQQTTLALNENNMNQKDQGKIEAGQQMEEGLNGNYLGS